MHRALRILAALILSLAVLTSVAAPNAVAATTGHSAIEQPAPFNPNPFRALYRFLKRLIAVPTDGGQIAPPHPEA